MVALIATIALLGIGAVTMMSMRSDAQAGGNERFQQQALYAAESGAAAGVDYLRNNCNATTLYSSFVEPNNVNPQSPSAIIGNNKPPGQGDNPFTVPATWYRVIILNNEGDSGYATGDDNDGVVVLRVEGHGPGETVSTVELEVSSPSCLAQFCDDEFAQKGRNSRNDSYSSACTTGEVANSSRVVQLAP